MIKLIIADDHQLVRDGLKAIMEDSETGILVVGQAASGKELIEMVPTREADVILMDINMPEMNGLEATHYIKAHFPHIKVLILSMMEQERYVAEAMKAGAIGYVLKTADQQELCHAIYTAARGEGYISTQITMKMLENLHNTLSAKINTDVEGAATAMTENPDDLSKRELEVLHLIAEGYTNAEIGEKLFTSKRTVESHRQNLLQKTGSKNTASLILYAARHHLLTDDKVSDVGK